MNAMFDISAAVAVLATVMMITRPSAVHALLYLTVSLLAVAMVFFVLGAPFAAALEVIIYAGAIMVLFVFVVMMLNIGGAEALENDWLKPAGWIGPSVLALLLALELGALAATGGLARPAAAVVGPQAVGIALTGPYMLAVEIASFLLLAALVAAFHLGRSVMKGV